MSSSIVALKGLSLSMALATCSSVMFLNVPTGSGYMMSAGVLLLAGGGGKKVLCNILLFSSLFTASRVGWEGPSLRLGIRVLPPSDDGPEISLCIFHTDSLDAFA